MLATDVKRNSVLTESERFGIPAHIHVCATAAGSVILDVRRDKYLGLGREDTEMLANAVPGWPKAAGPRSLYRDRRPCSEAERALCESLAADGVLERVSVAENARVVPALGDMRREWISIGDEVEVRGTVTLRHVVNFLSAYFWTRYSLARRPFFRVVEEVTATARKSQGVSDNPGWDINRLAAQVDVFRRLRPFVFAAEGHCLLHALTLVRFLSHYQFHPEWVIGVTTQPWGAHSWVQWDRYLLDSNPEKVCAYTPIMTV